MVVFASVAELVLYIAQVNHEFLNVTTITFTHGGRSDCNCYILPHDLVTIAEEASRNQKPVDFTFDQDLLPNFGDTTNYRVTSLRYR